MEMIKAIDDVKIKDFDKMKRSGKLSQFKTKWNVLPVFLFKKRLFSLVNEMVKMIESNKIDDDVDLLEFPSRTVCFISFIAFDSVNYCL